MSARQTRFLVLNLDDSLTWQERLLAFPHAWVDLTQVKGKKSCASPETLTLVERALDRYRDLPLCFWGTGDYHYITYARLRALRLPLTLVLVDHHHDCAPAQGSLITCGNWVRHALELPWIHRVLWIGGARPEWGGFRPHPKVIRVAETAPPDPFGSWLGKMVPTPCLYLSIDKDVLAPSDAITTWDAGDLPLANLLAWVRELSRHRRVVAADVGGEWVPAAGQVVLSPGDRRAVRQNEAANLAILEALWPALQGHHPYEVDRTG